VQPSIEYVVKGGELVKKLDAMMPKPTPVYALLRAPREDFAFDMQPYFLKVEDKTGVFGLVHGDAASLFHEEAAGGKVRVLVRAEIAPEDGSGPTVGAEREMLADVDPAGGFIASYKVAVNPGKYTLKVAVLDTNSKKGSVVTKPLEVPSFSTGELTIAPIIPLAAFEEQPKKDPKNALESFAIGGYRFVPRFGNVFKPSESLTVSYQFYDAKVDPATQKPATIASVRILKPGGSPIAQGPDDAFDTPIGGTIVGPIPLAKYAPGTYKIRLTVMDNVAGKNYTQDASFEVKAEGAAKSSN
jgi:hypothetical protein